MRNMKWKKEKLFICVRCRSDCRGRENFLQTPAVHLMHLIGRYIICVTHDPSSFGDVGRGDGVLENPAAGKDTRDKVEGGFSVVEDDRGRGDQVVAGKEGECGCRSKDK